MAASEKELSALHNELTDKLREAIKGDPVIDGDGNLAGFKANSAALNVARQFLKDNNIQATAENKGLKNLIADLPDFGSSPELINFSAYQRKG